MNDINEITLVGTVVRDAEVKETRTVGTEVILFSLAVNKYKKAGDSFDKETSFFDIVFFRKNSPLSRTKEIKKGDKVLVIGELKQERWQDKEGNNRTAIKIMGRLVEKVEKEKEKKQEQYNENVKYLKDKFQATQEMDELENF